MKKMNTAPESFLFYIYGYNTQVVVVVVGAVVVGVVDVVSGRSCCGCYNSKGGG
jgi:hypothetical protein